MKGGGKMKVYIAGSITNNPRYKEQFKTAEKRLINQGYAVINPVKNLGFEYREYIDMGLCELTKCDAIYMLHGYDKSEGAKLELHYAQTVGMKIIEEKSCLHCGFYNTDYEGCECPSTDKWYACPLEPEPSAEGFMTEEAAWHDKT